MRPQSGHPAVVRQVQALLLALLFLAAGVRAAPPVPSDDVLNRIDALLAHQAWQLALGVIQSEQKDPHDARWEAFERRRVRIYRNLTDVPALAERVEQLPSDATPALRRWALEQLIEAALTARDAARARLALEQLVASSADAQARPWRERLVRVCLEEGRVDEALAAFAPLAGNERMSSLHAEILLHAGRDQEAFEQVIGLQSPEARLWRLIAAMRLERYAPKDVVRELAVLVRSLGERPDLRRLAWLVRADAAARAGDLAPQVNSLEQAFQLAAPSIPRLVNVTPDGLWIAYLALARRIAATERLVPGAAALSRADRYAKQDPYTARALYAWHALEGKDKSIRMLAHDRLVTSLSARGLRTVTRVLYADSDRFALHDVPAGVRHVLLEEALQRQDLRVAARYAQNLERPPAGEPEPDWQLRRARVLLYGGEHPAAVDTLNELVARVDFDVAFARRFLQIVFDLQSMGQHDHALALLESVYARVDNARMHRELLYWQAQSAVALNRLTDAAELYLRSARFGDTNGSDPWGHSARFHAAEALTKAGLTKDAESLYRALLKETADPDRRVMIEQNIERLWLAAPTSTQ